MATVESSVKPLIGEVGAIEKDNDKKINMVDNKNKHFNVSISNGRKLFKILFLSFDIADISIILHLKNSDNDTRIEIIFKTGVKMILDNINNRFSVRIKETGEKKYMEYGTNINEGELNMTDIYDSIIEQRF